MIWLFACRRSCTISTDAFSLLQHQCIKNLAAVLAEAGSSIDKVVKVNVFLSDMDDFAQVNEVYSTYWGAVKPCRT